MGWGAEWVQMWCENSAKLKAEERQMPERLFIPSAPSDVTPSQPPPPPADVSSSTPSSPPASPPFILPLCASSVLYGTQLLIHSPCMRTHLPQVCPERTPQSAASSKLKCVQSGSGETLDANAHLGF